MDMRKVFLGLCFVLLSLFAILVAGDIVYAASSPDSSGRKTAGSSNDGVLKSNLRFSHKSHADARIRCEACHRTSEPPAEATDGWAPLKTSRITSLPVGVIEETASTTESASGTSESVSGMSSSANPFGRPPEKLCLRCHYHRKSKSDCGLCHLGKPLPTQRERARVSHGATFKHDQHAKVDCIECHVRTEKWETLDGSMVKTTMASCCECHTGVKIKKTCTLCHEKTPRPDDHGRNYERKHGIAWRSEPQSCRPCHEDSSCLACHAKRPRDHSMAWTARRHGISAQADPDRCAVCHSTKDVCRRCHPQM
ncbi:MAG: hypothetical protein WA705_15175 [Candidatus Ozemobacteraceae bacterium]